MEEKIINAYTVQRLSVKKVADKFGVTQDRVTKIQKKNGVQLRSLSESHSLPVDSNYFDEINAEEKAYWLGFIYADGYVTKNIFGIKLHEKDEEHLEKLKECLKSTHHIGHYINKTGFSKHEVGTPYCSLTIVNEQLVRGLVKQGVLYNKSATIPFPTEEIVPAPLLHHFVRGYFDGDGSVYGSVKAPAASFDGNQGFISTLLEVIRNVTGTKCNVQPDHSIFCIKLGGRNIIQKLYDYMYSDATVFLGRKKQRFEEILNL